jgi:Fe-S cluster assembly ATP-binding protein
MPSLEVQNLHVTVEQKEVVRGVTLTVAPGEVHALMGPNGSGKSSLASALMGHPSYQVTGGRAVFAGKDLLALKPEERAAAGLFLAFQYPQSVPGISVEHFLLTAYNAQAAARKEKTLNVKEFHELVLKALVSLELKPEFLERGLNDGFSGGEKKRLEVLQLKVLRPKLAILDETDSGLDVDALRLVAQGVNQEVADHKLGVLVITHYQRLLHELKPTHVHIMAEGKLIASAGPELVEKVEQSGYQQFVTAHV